MWLYLIDIPHNTVWYNNKKTNSIDFVMFQNSYSKVGKNGREKLGRMIHPDNWVLEVI